MIKKQLELYCKKSLLKYEIIESDFHFMNKKYKIVGVDELIFDKDFNFLPRLNSTYENFVYQFCGHWYLQEGEIVTMTQLKYLGESNQKIPTNNFIGIHSGNELLNGVGMYESWIKKAKFLKVNSLGICEKNSLAGVMNFQQQCLVNDIKPIIGISIGVKRNEDIYSVKCYCKDFIGWQNLLKFSHKINVLGSLYIEENFLIENLEGLFVIIDVKNSKFGNYSNVTEFYQLDTVVFDEETKDEEYLNDLEKFITSSMKPVMLHDAYYLEQYEWEARQNLWQIAKSFDYKSKNQYFKSSDEYAKELISLFEEGNKSWIKLFKEASSNLQLVCSECNFLYDTATRHLPKYEMNEEQKQSFKTKEQLFIHLVKKGFENRGIEKNKEYVDRLKKEVDVLKAGNVIDYFLILYDIVQFSKNSDILVGIGRGSAGGSLVSYLLGLIQLDPLKFELVFERFLNSGRMGSLEDCKAYEVETTDGKITLNEGSVLKVLRNEKELNIKISDLQNGDKILDYE